MACLSPTCQSYLSGGAGQTFTAAVQTLFAAQCLLTEDWPLPASIQDNAVFDFIVVGSGSAGAVVANRLSEVSNWNVLLIEAGGNPPLESIVPAFNNYMLKTSYDWDYYTSGQKNNTCSYYIPRGKMLGGSSSINANIYARGNAADYDNWYKMGNREWDYDTALRYFKKSEQIDDLTIVQDPKVNKYHGTGGLLHIARFNYTDQEFVENYKRAMHELGLEILNDPNGPRQLGVGTMRGTLFKGRRDSSAKAFLNSARDRPNLHLLTDTLVTRVIIDPVTRSAIGVEAILEDGTQAAYYVSKEVIVSAGTINTPQLLMLSGIGPKQHLNDLGIEVIADLPVGENLQDHVYVPVTISGNEGFLPGSSSETILDAAKYLLDQSGNYAAGSGPDVTAFFAINKAQKYPDFQITPLIYPSGSSLSALCDGTPGFVEEVCQSMNNMATNKRLYYFLVMYLHAKSIGNIELASKNPFDYPVINACYLEDQEDLHLVAQGARKVSELVNTTFFKSVGAKLERIAQPNCDRLIFESIEYWRCISFNLKRPGWHSVGTARMGPYSDKTTVVDSNLRVHTIKYLRVIDASIMPTLVSGNTNAPTIMIGERGSDLIKSTYGVS